MSEQDSLGDGPYPMRVERTPRLGFAAHGGFLFGYQRSTYFEDEEALSVEYELDLGPTLESRRPGVISLLRTGPTDDAPWGVDFERFHAEDGPMAPEKARCWAHALLAAADLADQVNRDEA